ncbi:FlgB family protein [Hyphomonas sediminis]|uniref:FlgB family protein n=1 Tax=Hyphomonas sediminis TaxID=2866160 RepID=UPI001CEDB4AF|nr:FlgB family protein [Hyphomonas sediminis]
MISDLQLFQIYGAMARHAAESQKVSATNIANADVPGFKADEIESFEDFLSRTMQSAGAEGLGSGFKTHTSGAPSDPNGNNVSLEQEVFNSAEALGQHNMALTVYSKSIDLLRTALGKPR